MIIWRRLGVVVPIVGVALLLVYFTPSWGGAPADYLTQNRWAVWATIGIASFALGLFGWLFNHRWRKPVFDPDTGAELGKSPSHSFFFVPVEYWSLLIPAVLLTFSWASQERAQKEFGYLHDPVVDDVYIVKQVEGTKPGWVGLFKVTQVSAQAVEVVPSTVGFPNERHARIAFDDGKSGVPGFYASERLELTRDRLVELWHSKAIERVLRHGAPEGL